MYLKNVSKRRKQFIVFVCLFLPILYFDPLTLLINKEKYLWLSVGYRKPIIFPNIKLRLALLMGAKLTYKDTDGNSVLDIADYLNNLDAAKILVNRVECKELEKNGRLSLKLRNFKFNKIVTNEFNQRCGMGHFQPGSAPHSFLKTS